MSTANKDVLPAWNHSNVIYQFLWHCDSRYLGWYFPKVVKKGSYNMLLNLSCKDTLQTIVDVLAPDNSIGAHLKRRTQQLDIFCKAHHERRNAMKKNSILHHELTAFCFSTLKATYIKTSKRVNANNNNSSIASNCHSRSPWSL